MTSQNYELRAYETSDAASIERIWIAAFGNEWPIDREQLGKILASQNQTNAGWCEVAVDHEPIGIIAYQQRWDLPAHGSIVFLLVDQAYRRQKIGTTLVRTALNRLRVNGVTSVELGAWADPRFWHGVPSDCAAASDFFRALGWKYYEENMDLIVELVNYVTPRPVFEKTTLAGIGFRRATEEDRYSIVEFVRREFPDFAPYYVAELQQNGTNQIFLAETGTRIDAAIISSEFPHCLGAHWSRLLGEHFSAVGALMVRRVLRRRGIGLGLIAHTMEELKRGGSQRCYLHWTWIIQMYGQLGAQVWRRYLLGRIELSS